MRNIRKTNNLNEQRGDPGPTLRARGAFPGPHSNQGKARAPTSATASTARPASEDACEPQFQKPSTKKMTTIKEPNSSAVNRLKEVSKARVKDSRTSKTGSEQAPGKNAQKKRTTRRGGTQTNAKTKQEAKAPKKNRERDIYIYAVKLLSGPSLGVSGVIIWSK